MEKVIADKNLAHVKLPQKILVIEKPILVKGIITHYQYLSPQEAEKVINENLKICVYFTQFGARSDVSFSFSFESEDYEPIIFANKESSAQKGYSIETHRDLRALCYESPFDIGYDNIFSTPNGDAIIIDTEFKGEPAEHACPKLRRYPYLLE